MNGPFAPSTWANGPFTHFLSVLACTIGRDGDGIGARMSVEEVGRRLATVLGRLDEAAEQITAAGMASAESRDALAHACAGTSAPDALDAVRSQEVTVDQLAEVRATVRAVRERVTAYLPRLGASPGPAAARTPEPTAVPKRSPNAVGVDGSEYPPEAAWAVPELPPRVRGFPDGPSAS